MVRFVSLVSGSSGNSTFISDGNTSLIVDCGMSGAALSQKLSLLDICPENLSGVLITHEHTDHTRGVGVIARRHKLPLYVTEKTFCALNSGTISPSQLRTIQPGIRFSIGSIDVQPFSIPHDAADPVGYCFFADGKKYTVATDIGFMPESLFENLSGSESIVLESNHDIEMLKYGSYPLYLKQRILSEYGHMSNDLTAETAVRLADSGTRHIMLAHLSHENNTPEIAEITTKSALSISGYGDVELCVAGRYELTSFAV